MSNKDVAWSFFEHLNGGRVDEAMALVDSSGSFWSLYAREAVPVAAFEVLTRSIMRTMPLRFTLRTAIEDGDEVALEAEGHAERADGFVYHNVYCFRITMRAGKLLHVREYLDTALVQRMLDTRRD